MRFVIHVLLGSLLLATGPFSSHASSPQQGAPNPNVVKVTFSPIDDNGKMITTLTQTDVRVFDDDKPQTILTFERMNEQPISVALLIDISMSEERLEKTAKLTARSFVESLMRSGIDRVAIVGFTGKLAVAQELTTEKERPFRQLIVCISPVRRRLE